jgi:endonuclease/exonuclease/phosphatase (EEP) superfamily protein YafD
VANSSQRQTLIETPRPKPPDPGGPWLIRLIRLAGWGAAGLSLLGFAGAIARAADLVSHFRVAYALAMLPALATFLPELRRKRWEPALLTLILALDTAPIAALYLPQGRIPEVGAGGPALRLLQFNTWVKNHDDEAVLALVEARRPDVAALQETTETRRAAVTDRLADRYHILSAGSELLLIRRDAPTIRLIDWARHAIPAGEAIAARLDVAGREVSVLTFHAMAPLGLARAASRDAQFAWAARWCRSQPGPVIVVGDLNATPWSYPFGRMLRDGGLVDSTRGFGVQPTWRVFYGPFGGRLAWPVQIPIDHCLHAPGLVAVAREVGPACGSNHFSLFVTLQWTGTATPSAALRRIFDAAEPKPRRL